MSRKTIGSLLLALLATSVLLLAQGRIPLRGTFDERLRSIEERMDAVEDRLARAEEATARQDRPGQDRLSLGSEAKLDRLEVRLIRLETNPPECNCGSASTQALLDRIRSIERQVARLRSSQLR